jgi:hypothetical protein
MTVISLGLRVVNLRSGARQCHIGAMLSEPELWGMLAADGWSRVGRCAWLSSLCRSWVFIASIAGVVIVIGVHGMMVYMSWRLRFSPRLLRIRIAAPCRAWWSRGSIAVLIVDRSCWMLGMDIRLCSAQGIMGRLVQADDDSTCCSPKLTPVLSPIQPCSHLSIHHHRCRKTWGGGGAQTPLTCFE